MFVAITLYNNVFKFALLFNKLQDKCTGPISFFLQIVRKSIWKDLDSDWFGKNTENVEGQQVFNKR